MLLPSRQFVLFSLVGTGGFLVDASVLLLALHVLGAGLYAGRLLSFLCAATFTWSMNRLYTFRGARPDSRAAQWARFLAVNALGAAVNLGVYAALVASVPWITAQPVIAVAAGSIAGLFFNFTLSRTFVFRVNPPP